MAITIAPETAELLREIDTASANLKADKDTAEELLKKELSAALRAIEEVFGKTIQVDRIPRNLIYQPHSVSLDIGPVILTLLQAMVDARFNYIPADLAATLHIGLKRPNQQTEVALAIDLQTFDLNEKQRQQIDQVVAAAARQLAAALGANVRYEHVTFFIGL